MHLGRLLLLAAVFHYVDDFHSIAASSGSMKEERREKRSSPAAELRLLGVVDVSTNEARVGPTDSRRSKLRNLSDKYINEGAISNLDHWRVRIRSLIRDVWGASVGRR